MWLSLDDPLGATPCPLCQQDVPVGPLGPAKGGWPETAWSSAETLLSSPAVAKGVYNTCLGDSPLFWTDRDTAASPRPERDGWGFT